MRLKKTWFHYIMLILYILFAGALYVVLMRSFLDTAGYPAIAFPISMLVFLVLPFLIFQLLHFLFSKGNFYRPTKELPYTVIEVGIVIILLIFVNAERLYGTLEFNVNFIGDLSCFNTAIVQKDQVISLLQYDSSHFYSFVLSVLFLFLGNNQFVGVLFNIFIQILALAVWYFAVRTYLGRFVATSTIVLLTVYPVFSNSVNYADPANFMLLLFGIALLAAFRLNKKLWEHPTYVVRGSLSALMTGIILGAAVYVDLVFLSVVIMVCLLILNHYQVKKNIVIILLQELLFLIGGAASFVLLIYVEALKTTTFYYDVLLSKIYSLENLTHYTLQNLYSGTNVTYFLVLLTISLFYVWGFLKNKQDHAVFFIFPMATAIFFQLVVAKKGTLDYQLILVSCLCIFVSVGLERMVRKDKIVEPLRSLEYPELLLYEENEPESLQKVQVQNTKTIKKSEKQDIVAEQSALTEQNVIIEEPAFKEQDVITELNLASAEVIAKTDESKEQKIINEEPVQEQMPRQDTELLEKKKRFFHIKSHQKQLHEKAEDNKLMETKKKEILSSEENLQTEAAEKQIKYIENPLPVPKRHVKKEMNYSFEPNMDFMDYDITELADGDDFDLLN